MKSKDAEQGFLVSGFDWTAAAVGATFGFAAAIFAGKACQKTKEASSDTFIEPLL